MKVLVVYDSKYGNTEKIAKAIADGVAGGATVVRAGAAGPDTLDKVDLLIAGSPTHGGRPSDDMKAFLDGLSETALKGVRVASFDTRLAGRLVKVFGFSADKIGASLTSKGGVMSAPPEPFFVDKTAGPLKEGELERAVSWGKRLSA